MDKGYEFPLPTALNGRPRAEANCGGDGVANS